jgi:hypothetical protein
VKTVASAKLSQEGCDIMVNAAIEKAKELKRSSVFVSLMPEVI